MSPLLPFLLRSLKYPRVESFNADDAAQFQALLVWLEHTKVRRYPIDGRKQLQSPDAAQWQAAFQKYLTDIECPINYDGANHRAVLQWLLTHAVGLEYQDSAQQLNQAAERVESEAGLPEEWTEQQLPPLPDITTDAVRAALVQLQQMLHVGGRGSGSGGSGSCAEATPEALHKAHAMLETCVLPALAELAKHHGQQGAATAAAAAAQAAAGSGGGGAVAAGQKVQQAPAVAAMLAQYPLGFSTGDPAADLAATVLRMLYIKDLRALQTLVDSSLVQVQEFTANPRTDASLGKVGR